MRLCVAALLLLILSLSVVVAGCQATVTIQPVAQPQAQPATASEPTPRPSPVDVAPEQTFTLVGNVGTLQGAHDVQGKAIVAGLQTLIIQGFSFDGKGPAADLRLVKGTDHVAPAAVLLELEPRPYEGEMLILTIPNSVSPENADRLAVYAPETGEVYAETIFR